MKSIEELAREFVTQLEGRFDADAPFGDLRNWSCYIALKSALETPPAEEWPQWFRCPEGDLYKFDGPGENGARWGRGFKEWGYLGKIYGLNEVQSDLGAVPIPAAEALAIIERASNP